jgi:sugar lactone lactonase YvrE
MNGQFRRKESFVQLVVGIVFLCVSLTLPGMLYAGPFVSSMPTAVDPRCEVSILVPGSHFHGIHGLTFDSQDNLYTGSVIGRAIYRVNPATGEVQEYIGPPLGQADDLEFGPDGRLYWTSFSLGKLHCKSADGKIVALAEGLPGINSLAFNQEGRLFATQVFQGDALHEIDLSGEKKTRKIAENLGGLNGFDFGPDGKLYGPLYFKGAIARVDVETGQVEIVSEGFKIPSAANFDSKGNLYAVDQLAGEVVRVDVKTGERTVVAKVGPGIDNLAIDSRDRLFITNMFNNGVYEVDTKTGKARTVVEGKLCSPKGLAVSTGADGDTLYLADSFAYRKVDGFTGEVTIVLSESQMLWPWNASVHEDSVILTSFMGQVQELDRASNQSKRILKGFKTPVHALMMEDGSLIVAEMETGNLLRVYGSEGEDRTVIAKELALPVYLAIAGPDAVFVTEKMAGTVTRIDLSTGDKETVASGLKTPEGVAVHPDGKLVVVDTGTRQLVEIDPASGAISPMVINLAVSQLGILNGAVAVSESGVIYVSGNVDNVLYKITLR